MNPPNKKKHLQSYRNMAGMTLFELMFGLFILAILIAVSIPYYQEYIAKMQVREGQNMVLAAGANVGLMNEQLTCAPNGKSNTFTGRYGSLVTSGSFKEVKGKSCRTSCKVTFTFDDEVSGLIQEKTITAEILNSGDVSLLPSETTLSNDYLSSDLKMINTVSTDPCTPIVRTESSHADSTVGTPIDASMIPMPNTASRYPFAARNFNSTDVGPVGAVWYRGYFLLNASNYNSTRLLSSLSNPFSTILRAEPYAESTLLINSKSSAATVTSALSLLPGNPAVPADPISNYYVLSDQQIIKPGSLSEQVYLDKNNNVLRKIGVRFDSLPKSVFDAYSSITLTVYTYRIVDPSLPGAPMPLVRNLILKAYEVTLPRIAYDASGLRTDHANVVNSVATYPYEIVQNLGTVPPTLPLNVGNQSWSMTLPYQKGCCTSHDSALLITFNK